MEIIILKSTILLHFYQQYMLLDIPLCGMTQSKTFFPDFKLFLINFSVLKFLFLLSSHIGNNILNCNTF